MPYPKKVGLIPAGGNHDKQKQTNEIKIAPELLKLLDLRGKNVTADALLTQREFAKFLVEEKSAHYFFTVKKNQPELWQDIEFYFSQNQYACDAKQTNAGHGRVEKREIWTTTELNGHLRFPHVKQVFKIHREVINKKNKKKRCETVYGITSRPEQEADPQKILKIIRGHWCVENSCHYILDTLYQEDQSTIRTGNGPENVSRLRRFAIGILKQKDANAAQKARRLSLNTRMVLDYLKMTVNSRGMQCRRQFAA